MTEETRPGLRERLRALPVLGTDLPGLDPDAAPDDPVDLFVAWLEDAVDAGLPAPHAATLSTADAGGRVDARTLILQDVGPDGWSFATRSDSPKGAALAENPHAALTFLWRERGRQVRVRGPVVRLGPEASAADFSRGPSSRARRRSRARRAPRSRRAPRTARRGTRRSSGCARSPAWCSTRGPRTRSTP